jgi:hypothetical protein
MKPAPVEWGTVVIAALATAVILSAMFGWIEI